MQHVWLLFLIVLDKMMRKAVGSGETGIRWKLTSKLDDLDLADEIVLISSTKKQIQGLMPSTRTEY